MTKQIPLTQGKFATVDDDVFEFLNQWKWFASQVRKTEKWYAVRDGHAWPLRKTIKMHRVIMDVTDPSVQVDHRNGDGLFNVRKNLRVCNDGQNKQNSGKRKDNTSGFKGVSKAKNRYRADISVDGKKILLGTFLSAEEAARAYDSAARKYHGEFAKTNFGEQP